MGKGTKPSVQTGGPRDPSVSPTEELCGLELRGQARLTSPHSVLGHRGEQGEASGREGYVRGP